MPKYNILVVDDELSQREALAGFITKKGFTVYTAQSGNAAVELLKNKSIDMVLTDMRMPEMDGLELLQTTKEINPNIEVIVMTAYGSIEGATGAMKQGAADFITKPVDLDQLELIVNKVLEHKQLIAENKRLKELVNDRFRFGGIISGSSPMQQALSVAARVADSKASVLITGESGTGKELVAKAIHFAGSRASKPFIAVNMAALPENLVESELFGHEKGAFTGADRFRKGRFESAHEGTIFFDEVGDVPKSTQVKLLRVLQEHTIERIGSSDSLSVDVRIIAATNKKLEEMVKTEQFREDLFYRLNVVKIELPPLRQRKSDIPLLINHFINRYSVLNGKKINGLTNESLDKLMKYQFPGNVRELENIIEQAVVLCRDDILSVNDLPASVVQSPVSIENNIQDGTFQQQVENFEKKLILDALKNNNNIQTKAAASLGMTERHLRYKLKKYALK